MKKRFVKDLNLFQDYCKFMRDLFHKEYAERSLKPADDNCWYTSHHGVYHPVKPSKMRVVYDCNLDYLRIRWKNNWYQDKISIATYSVLTRFRKEQVAFKENIEAMYYQVRIPKCQWSMLCFLRLKGNAFNNQPNDYHVFGLAPSPSCCNKGSETPGISVKVSTRCLFCYQPL